MYLKQQKEIRKQKQDHIQYKKSWHKIALEYLLKQQKLITPALKVPVDLYIEVSKLQRRFKNEVSYM